MTLLLGIAIPVAGIIGYLLGRRGRTEAGTTALTAFSALHSASLATPALRAGLVASAADKAIRHLRDLLGTTALAITDEHRVLAWDGEGTNCHGSAAFGLTSSVLSTGRTQVFGRDQLGCTRPGCPIRHLVAAPLLVDERAVGAVLAYCTQLSPGMVRATTELARWVSGQLELAELDRSRAKLAEAEVRALRAQISPHFIYNSLTVIASFVRTDPERARQLLLEFADFTRYSFRRHGDFTTLADELRSIDKYLALQRARFGDRLRVTLRIGPEVLPVAVPFLCLQPLVENAIKHGMEGRVGTGELTLIAEDNGAEVHVSIEDNGSGMDPDTLGRTLAGDTEADAGIGLGNIDERLRQVYGDDYGLVIETAPGAGTKVHVHIPKYRAGVQAS